MEVEDTNAEALAAKLYAASLGYFQDNYASEFVPKPKRRDVIINRGYWARTTIFKSKIVNFLKESKQKVQVLSLGCGLDTLFFNLWQDKQIREKEFKFFQIDLPKVAKRKADAILKSKKINALLSGLTKTQAGIQHANYVLRGCDITLSEQLSRTLEEAGLDFQIKTIVFLECVLAYIPDKPFFELMAMIKSKLKKVRLLNYEMMNANDRFGKMMVKNFSNMGLPLQGIFRYENKQGVRKLMQELGWRGEVESMLQVYNRLEERSKIERIEMLDEFQQWNMIMQHYFFLDMELA